MPIPPNWVPSGGSGSGSGSGGPDCLEPVTVTCTNGTRVITVKDIKVGIVNNRLVLEECSQNDTSLGPCSPVTPGGTTLPVVTLVCPTFTTLRYLDWDSNPQTVDVITSIDVQRRLVTVPVAGPTGCVTDPEECCEGSGSGSGSTGCTSLCEACGAISQLWTVNVPGFPVAVLTRVGNPNDGNECRFVSDGLGWDLYYDVSDDVWFLVNYDTEDVWFLEGIAWRCLDPNTMTHYHSGEEALLTPQDACSSWNCVDGTCVEVEGGGGTYPTESECLLACGSFPACADAPETMTATVTTTDTPCMVGLVLPLTKAELSDFWFNNNSPSPCSTDTGFGVTCSVDGWVGFYNGCSLVFVGETPTTLTFNLVGACPPGITGVLTTFVVSIP